MVADFDFKLKWDPKNLEIKTRSVEKALEPLVIQVTTLVNSNGFSNKKKGCSKKAVVLVATVEEAFKLFIENGKTIAKDNPEASNEIMKALDEVKLNGQIMSEASREFADDPCSSLKRASMVKSARALLSSVTRLLIVADMVDMYNLLKRLKKVEQDLQHMRTVSTQQEFIDRFAILGQNIQNLYEKVGERQKDLKNPKVRDCMASARASLKKNRDMLFTTTKAYLRHPEISAAKSNRDYVLDEMLKAIDLIDKMTRFLEEDSSESCDENFQNLSLSRKLPPNRGSHDRNDDQNNGNKGGSSGGKIGDLAAAIERFQQQISVTPNLVITSVKTPHKSAHYQLQSTLEDIISGAMGIAQSPSTRDETRDRILEGCDRVREALQELLTEFMGEDGDKNNQKLDRTAEELKAQLKRAVVDHVSDSFLETGVPLLILARAATEGGSEAEIKRACDLFEEHAKKLIQVADLACSLSTHAEGVQLVRLASRELTSLYPQVVNAAKIVALRPNSKPAKENFKAFSTAWQTQVRILTEAVDDITTVQDFLAVSENHILEDMDACIQAFRNADPDRLDRTAGAIRGRTLRVCEVVSAEMDGAQQGAHADRVLGCVDTLRNQLIPFFSDRVRTALAYLSDHPRLNSDPSDNNVIQIPDALDNDFIEANRCLLDGVRDVRESTERRSLLTSPASPNREENNLYYDMYDEYNEAVYEENEEEHYGKGFEEAGRHGKDTMAISNANDRAIMRQLPDEAKAKIQMEIKSFREQKAILDREVSKWEDSGNDIVVIAKRMCIIMMEMTDFTRGRGPLKSTMDVISAAQKISEVGKGLDKLARAIADTCPESTTKQDLLAYLQRLDLYCQQLAITSKVKADVTNVGGEIVVSGLDSVTSLITTSKNLMNTVVLIVKSSYVASTKYSNKSHRVLSVVWRMKPPEKKPLIRVDKFSERSLTEEGNRAIIRRGSNKRREAPIKALNEFHQNF